MILLIGGTTEGKKAADFFEKKEICAILSCATTYGKDSLDEYKYIRTICGRMNLEEIENFIDGENIDIIIDASHPFAVEISKNCISAAKNKNIKYIRIERERAEKEYGTSFDTADNIKNYIKHSEGNILFTTGSKDIDKYIDTEINMDRVYARVIPDEASIKKCIDAGIRRKNIIAIQGPFSTEFNQAVIRELKIKIIVTKESGISGGELEKIESAKLENIEIVMLKKPAVNYPIIFNSIEEAEDTIKYFISIKYSEN